jgi:F-type H+-transporting ATPase subunit a
MNAFLGPIEIISEITRLITLALRLFGVIYAGEVLLHVITQLAGNFASIGTIPIVLMEIFFASLQAYLFIMLSSVYLQMGTAHDEQSDSHSPAPIAKTAAGEAG